MRTSVSFFMYQVFKIILKCEKTLRNFPSVIQTKRKTKVLIVLIVYHNKVRQLILATLTIKRIKLKVVETINSLFTFGF